MPADSLLEMARRACCRYSRRVDDIGDLPYEMVRPILIKIENPAQLYQLEQRCPQIVGEDAEIWQSMIKRDIPNWESKPHRPSNPKNWHKVYRKLKQEAKEEMVAGEERLKAALSNINNRKEEKTAQVVSGASLPRPREPKKRFGYDARAGWTPTHKLSPLEKIRRESRIANSHKMNRPTHELGKRSSGLKQAPAGFVEDLRREKQARATHVYPRSPQPSTTSPRQSVRGARDSGYDLIKDREDRLRALKLGSSPSQSRTSASSDAAFPGIGLNTDFLEDDELDEDDDLFGELPKAKSPSDTSRQINTPPKVLKRKPPPSLFHEPKRRNVVVK